MSEALNFIPQTGETTTCAVCGYDKCIKEKVNDTAFSYLCIQCGYMSSDYHVKDSSALIDVSKNSPDIVMKLSVVDTTRGIVWIPCILQSSSKGWVYPIPLENGDWKWSYAPIVDIPEADQINYPVAGKDGEYHQRHLDVESAEIFEQNEFYLAIQKLGAIVDMSENSE